MRKDIAVFKGIEFKTICSDDGGTFKGVCHDYLENVKPKTEKGSITNIQGERI